MEPIASRHVSDDGADGGGPAERPDIVLLTADDRRSGARATPSSAAHHVGVARLSEEPERWQAAVGDPAEPFASPSHPAPPS
ncbi:hypothetical protein [Streptomyces sp. WAC 06738]|uniref:hypothetical protein n=1 Tax=Streptomyces sp. WAC 06738 TaxID=2203210 RepID=UPI000F78E8B7|nr:hypothetical protein [Streptomyces sp. WAC 06738]